MHFWKTLFSATGCSHGYPQTKKPITGTKNMQGRYRKQSLKGQSDLSQATNFNAAVKEDYCI